MYLQAKALLSDLSDNNSIKSDNQDDIIRNLGGLERIVVHCLGDEDYVNKHIGEKNLINLRNYLISLSDTNEITLTDLSSVEFDTIMDEIKEETTPNIQTANVCTQL